MKRLLTCLLLAAFPLFGSAAGLQISDAWIRAAPPGARMLAGYAVLTNNGDVGVRLVAANSERFGLVEIHRTAAIDGVARMRQVESVEVAAGASIALQPGELHLMLMRPLADVTEGERIGIQLEFDDGSAQRVEFEVRRLAPSAVTTPQE